VPLVIYLPPTGGTAAELESYAQRAVGFTNYVALLPEGAPTRAEYADFDHYSAWFDARVSADIARARSTYAIDPQRIYVVGFSLGGDLAWAMLGMHPDRFAGAFVMGSRCGAHVSSNAMRTMQTRNTRIVFAIGDQDLAARDRGLRAAQRRSDAAHVTTRLVVFHGMHEPPDEAAMRAGFAFLRAVP
jgi:predicted peptidase